MKKLFFKDWEELLAYERICRVLSLVLGIAAAVLSILAILQITEVLTISVELLPWCLILLGLENLSNAACTWKKSRSTAIISLCSGLFVIACSIIGLYLQGF